MNNKGFTLIELLAVLAVMITILLIAVPSISSSVERNKDKLDKQKKETITTAADIYIDLYYNKEEKEGVLSGGCGIRIMNLITADLVEPETTIMEDGSDLKELCVHYDKDNKDYIIQECASCEAGG